MESTNNSAQGQGTAFQGNPIDFEPKNAGSVMSTVNLAQGISPVKIQRNIGYAGLHGE